MTYSQLCLAKRVAAACGGSWVPDAGPRLEQRGCGLRGAEGVRCHFTHGSHTRSVGQASPPQGTRVPGGESAQRTARPLGTPLGRTPSAATASRTVRASPLPASLMSSRRRTGAARWASPENAGTEHRLAGELGARSEWRGRVRSGVGVGVLWVLEGELVCSLARGAVLL